MITLLPYGAVVAEHFRRPRNRGSLEAADCSAEGVNPLCGDRVRLELALAPGAAWIDDARFTADACAICIAAASVLTERLRGMAVRDALMLPDDISVQLLGTEVPPARRRCAVLPLDAARQALATLRARG